MTAGVNLRPSASSIKESQARRLLNCSISNKGELVSYPGWETFSITPSLGARRIQGAKRVYTEVQTRTVFVDNGSVYAVKDDRNNTFPFTPPSARSTTNAVDIVFDRDIFAIFDGLSVPVYAAEIEDIFYQLGITAPSAPSLSAVAGGSLVSGNTYEVGYAYVNSGYRNQMSSLSVTDTQQVSGGNLSIRVPITASSDPQVDEVRIYARDVTAGETVLRLAATFDNTSNDRDLTSNTWDGQEEAPEDHGVAPTGLQFGFVWKNRWWGVIGNTLHFSEIFQPLNWPSTYNVDIPLENGEVIKGGRPLGDILVLFGHTRAYIITGQTALDFEVRPALGSQTGVLGFNSLDAVESGILHAGVDGVYLYNGATDTLLSYPIQPAWQHMVATASPTDLARVPVVYHKAEKEVRIAVADRYPDGGRGEWILDLNRSLGEEPAWFSTDRDIGGYVAWDGPEDTAGNQGRILSFPTTAALFREERVGTTADGGSLTAEYDGPALPLGLQMNRVVDTYVEVQPLGGTLTVDLAVDGALQGAQTVTTSGAVSLYGVGLYGVASYSTVYLRQTKPLIWPLTAEGRTAQLFIRYTGTDTMKFFSYTHNVVPETYPRGI